MAMILPTIGPYLNYPVSLKYWNEPCTTDFLTLWSRILFSTRSNSVSERIIPLPIIEVVDKITEALDQRKITVGVFLDLSKAFDTIKHDILFKKLEHYG